MNIVQVSVKVFTFILLLSSAMEKMYSSLYVKVRIPAKTATNSENNFTTFPSSNSLVGCNTKVAGLGRPCNMGAGGRPCNIAFLILFGCQCERFSDDLYVDYAFKNFPRPLFLFGVKDDTKSR